MTKVKRFNSTQPLANATSGHWVKASDYDALWCKLAEVEAERDQADKLIADAFADAASNNIRLAEASHRAEAAEAALPAVYRLAWEDAYQEHPFNAPTPTAAELMARIQTVARP